MRLWVWKGYISVFIIILFKLHSFQDSQLFNCYKRIHEKIFVNSCYFCCMWKRIWRKLQNIGDIPLTCTLKEILFNRKRSFYYSNQQTFCFNNIRSLFMFCTQKHLSNVTQKRTSSGDKGFLSHLANSNWFGCPENLPELAEMLNWNVVTATCNSRKIQFFYLVSACVGRFLPHRGSNSGRQITGPVLYQLSYSVLNIECWSMLAHLYQSYPRLYVFCEKNK